MARESTIGSMFYLEASRATAVAFSAVTKGATTSLTVASAPPGVEAGSWIVISGSDLPSLDRTSPHRVISASASAVVVDTDTTADVPAGTAGELVLLTMQEVCLTEFTPSAPEPGEVDVTTMCDTVRRTVAGLSSPGSISFGGPFDMEEAGMLALIAAQKDGVARGFSWVTRGGQAASMFGQVASFVGAPQGVEQAVTYSGSFQVQDGPFYYKELP
jgi:hypothetical protein